MKKELVGHSGIVVRALREEDIPDVTPILEHFVRNPKTGEIDKEEIDKILEGMQGLHREDWKYKVAKTAHGRIAGVMALQAVEEDLRNLAFTPHPVELRGVFVAPEHQGEGVGKKLLQEALKTAHRMGYLEIVSKSRVAREEGHSFYDHMGFTRRGLLQRPNGKGAAIVWSKIVPG